MIVPPNMDTQYPEGCDLTLTFQARGDEGDSPLRGRVAWDGQWEDGEQEMRRHLTIETLSA